MKLVSLNIERSRHLDRVCAFLQAARADVVCMQELMELGCLCEPAPTNEFIAEKFFRKTFLNLLKKYIDTKVILLSPFDFNFVLDTFTPLTEAVPLCFGSK